MTVARPARAIQESNPLAGVGVVTGVSGGRFVGRDVGGMDARRGK